VSLATCFQHTSENYPIKVKWFVMNQPYPITRVIRCDTRYGSAVLLTSQESENGLKKFLLPRRYSNVMIDEDLKTNSGKKVV
jgi:hypothetical protein